MAERALNGLIGAFAHETVTVAASGTNTLTSTVYNTVDTGPNGQQVTRKIARYATISVEGDKVRYWTDGTTPDATHGHQLDVNDVLFLSSERDIQNVKFFGNGAGTVTLQVTYA